MTTGAARPAIGIDVGGTKTLAELIDPTTGAAIASLRIPTSPTEGGAAVLDRCLALARQLSVESGIDPAALRVGVAVCEMVDGDGRLASAATIDWLDLDVAGAFVELAGFGGVTIESDVRAAAIAESRLGAASGTGQSVYVGVGTGIAYTLMVDGQPHRGAHGTAILLGVPPVERVASGPAIAARAGTASAEEAFADPNAREVIADAARQLGVALAWLNNALDPELFVVGGGLGVRADFMAAAVASMRAAVVDAGGRPVDVRAALLGERSAVVGAALVADDAATPPRR